ncbi:TrmH family RNA methyltransferase [Humitalea sp. 24SJ18S-53]|uniref:TrmH family RNA methyltransferase n=1 Tax=Humitalea sp. 24SJ18S-53 TaxID=3422307 RepID=UPI003D6657D1
MSFTDPDRICGAPAVAALFACRPAAVLRLFYVPEQRFRAGPYCALLAKSRRPYREVPPEEMTRIAGTPHHGGIVGIAEPRSLMALPDNLAITGTLLPVLDGVGNPHNLGALARTAAFFGARAMLLGGMGRAGLSDAAYRVSEGGLEHLTLYRADPLASVLRGLAPRMLTVVAVAAGGVAPAAVPRDRPIALVLGNEETGPAPDTIAACEMRVTLPGSGLVESLNVSAAAAVLFHALT